MNTRITTFGLSLLAVLGSASVSAQTTSEPTDSSDAIELPDFTVSSQSIDRYRASEAVSAARIRAPLIDTPSSISVMTRDLIEDIQPQRLFDATRYIAGVQEGRGTTFSDRQIIRGFESDGRTVDNFRDSTGLNFPEAIVDRIEVTKGPNAILSPGGVPGGAINVITKSPTFDRRHSVTALVGLYDAQKLTFDLSDSVADSEALAYRLVGSWQDSARYWSSDAKLKHKLIAPSITWRLGRNTQLTAKYFYYDSWIFREPLYILDASVDAATTPILAPGFEPKSLNGIAPWSGLSMQTHSGHFQLSTSFNDRVSMRLAGQAVYFTEDSEQQIVATSGFSNRYNPSTGELTQDYTWTLDGQGQPVSTFSPYYNPSNLPTQAELDDGVVKLAALQNDWVLRFNPSGLHLQTVAGWAVSTNHGSDQRWRVPLPGIDLANPVAAARHSWTGGEPETRHVANENFDWQAYVNQRVTALDGRLILNAGALRYGTDTSSIDYRTGAPANKLQSEKNMYLGSIMYKVLPNMSLYYSYSTNATPAIVNERPLWREGKQQEIGAKWQTSDGKFSVNTSYFEISQTNVSVPNPDRLVDPNAPGSLVSDLDNHGWELEVSGAITDRLSVYGSVSLLKLRDSLGRPIRAVADELAAVMFSYRFGEGALHGLALNAGAVYTSERPGDATPINFTSLNVVTKQSFFIPSYTLYNIGASYGWDRYNVRLYLDNVTDKKDFVYLAGSRVATGTAPGINARLSLTVKF
ncbi:TonB-dependent siderophore receptor [Opitutales bacterium ASA1]|uniref:TonB-dependent siderophore receptor n=1 Tax=Congregicoccus parvus TaxID=3081749 RepID=UPI002B2C465B|nr:TonB-dependent siderophore receptor [Opitutales bacterium ASA1]